MSIALRASVTSAVCAKRTLAATRPAMLLPATDTTATPDLCVCVRVCVGGLDGERARNSKSV